MIDVNKIYEMREQGKTNKEIAKELNVCVDTIYKNVRKNKQTVETSEVKYKSPNTKISKLDEEYNILFEHRKEVIQMYKEGTWKVNIAKYFNVSEEAVFEFFNYRTKFEPEQMKEMREMLKDGKSIEYVAMCFETKPQIISNIFKSVYIPETKAEVIDKTKDDFKCVEMFADYIRWIEYEYGMCQQNLVEVSKRITDLMHKIEFEDYEKKDAMTLIENLKDLRNQRREYKDFMELVEPLIDYMNEGDNGTIIKNIANLALEINNKAKVMKNRIYSYRRGEV